MPKKGTKRSSSGIGNDLNESHSKRVRSSTKLLLEKPDLFKELLTEAGFNLPVDDDNSNTLNVDQAVFQKSLKRLLSKYDKEQVNNEFLGGLQTHIDNLERFRTSLLPTISSSSCQSIRCGNQESLIHLLLGVDSIQKQLVTILLEKLPELEEDDSNIGMLVLNQFRWLDKVVDSKMLVKKVFEILQVVSPNFQSHLILTLPEIIEDYQNEEVARYLQELLVENHQLAIPIIDALSNMQLDADQVQEAQNAAINILESASTDSLAVIVRFILLSVASNTEFNVISSLRSHLDLQFNMVPMISSTPARKLTEGNKKHENSDGFLILDTIHRVLRFNAVVANGFLKAIGDVDSADGHMVLDVYVILMLYSNVNYKKLVLTMLSNKIRNGLITIALLQTALISYPQLDEKEIKHSFS
ncbi:Fanconi anemia group D2 protein-like [Antedon mediterranea]|uniref:Fanconi anemia group D2 protein-like n=1 Tax=Antedon mediterranea TaxID=105859 RepID=UPI003AF68052